MRLAWAKWSRPYPCLSECAYHESRSSRNHVFGHAAFSFKTPSGKHVIVDPWLEQNPACPPRLKNPAKVDTLLITHGHFDHIADAVSIAKKHDATCIAIIETAIWLGKKGVSKLIGLNKGGINGDRRMKVTMVHAAHSSGIQDGDQASTGAKRRATSSRSRMGSRSIMRATRACTAT